MKTLEELLNSYGQSDFYGFHMPGHKRNSALMGNSLPYKIDVTELEEFDDLHHANGVLLEAEKRAAILFRAEETYFLVNGSTVGNLSAVMACTHLGGKILISRNCHKSVYNAIYLQELNPVYVYPQFSDEIQLNGEVLAEDVADQLQGNPDVEAVVIVSPTYDGVVSDIESIARVVHQYGKPLIVDEAHGSHFGFHEYFPKNANVKGADIVIHSVHKTLPSLTQTALLHINGNMVNRQKVKMYLGLFQSSSPSYVLMASIDSCMELLARRGEELFSKYVDELEKLRGKLRELKHLKLLETKHYDKSKIIISVKDAEITSKELYHTLLREYHLQMEMEAGTYIAGMTSIGDKPEGFARLGMALKEIDDSISVRIKKHILSGELPRLKIVYTSAQMEKMKGKACQKCDEGFIASRYQYMYPPGIPIVVPGECITPEIIKVLKNYKDAGFLIEG